MQCLYWHFIGTDPVWSESLLSAFRNLGSLATHWAHIRVIHLVWSESLLSAFRNLGSLAAQWAHIRVIRPVWSESLLSAFRNRGCSDTYWVHSEDWSDWADAAQANLSLLGAQVILLSFVMLRLIWAKRKVQTAHRHKYTLPSCFCIRICA